MTTDSATGLPELPEGQWWEVKPHTYQKYHYSGDLIEESDGYKVCLMRNKNVPGSEKPGAHWWSDPIITPPRVKPEEILSLQITDPVKYAESQKGRGFYNWYSVGATFLTPDMILKVARDILDIVDSRAQRAVQQAATDALVGKYPPKKLGAS